MIPSEIAIKNKRGQEMTGCLGGLSSRGYQTSVEGSVPVVGRWTRDTIPNSRDRNKFFPGKLTSDWGSRIVNKIQHLRHGEPHHLRRKQGGHDFHDLSKYTAHRIGEGRREKESDASTRIWSRLVDTKRPPPLPTAPRDISLPDGPMPALAILSPREAALARARIALEELAARRQGPKEHSISTHRAAFRWPWPASRRSRM